MVDEKTFREGAESLYNKLILDKEESTCAGDCMGRPPNEQVTKYMNLVCDTVTDKRAEVYRKVEDFYKSIDISAFVKANCTFTPYVPDFEALKACAQARKRKVPRMNHKVAIVVSDEVESLGKVASIAVDLTIQMLKNSNNGIGVNEDEVLKWVEDGSNNIILSVPSKCELINIILNSVEAGIPITIFREDKVLLAVAIGPGVNKQINKITGNLELL